MDEPRRERHRLSHSPEGRDACGTGPADTLADHWDAGLCEFGRRSHLAWLCHANDGSSPVEFTGCVAA